MFRIYWLHQLSQRWFSQRGRVRQRRLAARTGKPVRLVLEQLETRLTPSAPTLSTLAAFNDNGPSGPVMDSGGNLYVAMGSGGTSNDGRIIELAKGSSTITTLASFNGTNGVVPTGLVMDGSGNLYGVTQYGGPSNDGTVFELAKGSSTITTLASFSGTNSLDPYGGLIMDGSGNLYGTTAAGGASREGTIFELAKGSSTITTLASFSRTDHSLPTDGLLMDGSGNLYGTTTRGGASDLGTVFELAKGSSTMTTLASFNGFTPSYPYCGLVMDGSGNLYGTTEKGGASDFGTVFELATGSSTITTLASFSGANGLSPTGRLLMDGSGNLYGTTEGGGTINDGAVFELAKGSSTITALSTFNGINGSSPIGGLVMDGSGNLYSTTQYGGASGDGTVFELAKGSSTITTLVSLNGTSGSAPIAGLLMDGSGNLYSTTLYGGASGDGTVFELAKGSSTITTLATFNGTNGSRPIAGLLMDDSGTLYGTTEQGGASDDGTVFELVKGSSTNYPLAYFNGTNGEYPNSGLIMDGSGNLYGTTFYGGASGYGTVFELAKGRGTITTLASFNGTNGAYPVSGLLMDGSGNLYGTTSSGGASGDGTVFELATGSSTITTLASFNGTNGAGPEAGLLMDGSGNLYGTTSYGGPSNDGTVFELAKGSNIITTLASFNGTNGLDPRAGLVMDGSGNLYSTTWAGGASGDGTVFELAKGSSTITTLASFNGINGSSPGAGLIMDGSGNLYGTTREGGPTGEGVIFELQMSTNGNTAPVITAQPSSVTVTAGQNATFTATASGNPTPTVQWQYSTDHGTSWTNLSNGTNVSGATSTTLTLSNVTVAMNGYEYEAVFSNGIGSPATTTAATLTVDSAAFLKTDATTQGNWKGVYGSQGYNVIEEASSYPSYAQVNASGNTDWIWSGTTQESRALQEVGNDYRLAASWFSNSTFTVNMNLSGGQTHQLALYLLDWDSKDRSEQIQLTDAATGTVLSTQTASNFVNGAYLVWNVSGDIDISITHLGGDNAVLSGLFLDPATLPSPPPSSASFVKTDTTTQGNWKGVYGSQGYNVIEEASSYPSYAQVSVSGNTDWIWSGTTDESRALQEVGNNYRLAASWLTNTTFTINMNLSDGQTRQLALYLLDWDNKDRSEQIQITDATTGAVLSTQTASNFVNGEYLVWNVSGDIDISITHLGGDNAVLSGLFLDPDEA